MQEVSVVIPYYNNDIVHISTCLASLRNLGSPQPEIILVNDGSKQHYCDILRTLQKQWYFTLVVLSENRGPAAARNAGILQASNPYVFMLDADDAVEPLAIAACLDAIGNKVLAYTDSVRYDRRLWDFQSVRRKARAQQLHEQYKGTIADPLLHFHFVHYAVLYQKDALTFVGGYREDLRTAEDYDLNLRLSELSREVNFVHVAEDLHAYRIHENSLSQLRAVEQQKNTEMVLTQALKRRGFQGMRAVYRGVFPMTGNTYYDTLTDNQVISVRWAEEAWIIGNSCPNAAGPTETAIPRSQATAGTSSTGRHRNCSLSLTTASGSAVRRTGTGWLRSCVSALWATLRLRWYRVWPLSLRRLCH